MKSPEINLCTSGQFIYDKEIKKYAMEKRVSAPSDNGETGQQPTDKQFKTFSCII